MENHKIQKVPRMFSARAHGDWELLQKLWAMHRLWNGERGREGLREFILAFLSVLRGEWQDASFAAHPERRRLLSRWMEAVLKLTNQQGYVAFKKGCSPTSSDGTIHKLYVPAIERISPELAQDFLACHQLFVGEGWYPFNALVERYAAMGDYFLRQFVQQALEHISSYRELRAFAANERAAGNDVGDPSFTLPDAVKHPRYLVLSAPQTSPSAWWDLDLGNSGALGEIVLRTFQQQPGEGAVHGRNERQLVRFHSDKRFSRIHDVVSDARGVRGLYRDPFLGADRQIQFCGVRLRFRNVKLDADRNLRSATVYLDFTADLEQVKLSEAAKAATLVAKKGATNGDDPGRLKLEEGTVVASVMLNPNGIAWVSVFQVMRGGALKLLRTKNITPAKGLTEEAIREVDTKLRKKLRLSGGKQRGQRFAVGHQRHLTRITTMRLQTGARAVVNFCAGIERVPKTLGSKQVAVPASVIVVGTPASLKVFSRRSPRENRKLMGFASMELAAKIASFSRDLGMKSIDIWKGGYQQICSACGALGLRYRVGKRKEGGSEIQFDHRAELFACPDCKRVSVNAFMNATHSLLQMALQPAIVAPYKAKRQLEDEERKERAREMQAGILAALHKAHQLPALESFATQA